MIASRENPVGLFQLADGRFQMTRQGDLSGFMSGPSYILIETKLFDFLRDLDIPDINFEPAIVWNRKLDKEYKNYKQLYVNRYITKENFEYLDLNSFQMYIYGTDALFVSPDLKTLLENSGFDFLKFHEGFSDLVGRY